MTSRPLRRLYPEPSAPSLDEGYFGSPSRGMKHPRSESPFSRNVWVKTKQEMEAISGLLDFTERPPPPTRNYSTTPKPASPQTVTAAIRPFPTTPAAATRPPRPPPPRIVSRRPVAALSTMARPHPLRSGDGGFTSLRGTESSQQQQQRPKHQILIPTFKCNIFLVIISANGKKVPKPGMFTYANDYGKIDTANKWITNI